MLAHLLIAFAVAKQPLDNAKIYSDIVDELGIQLKPISHSINTTQWTSMLKQKSEALDAADKKCVGSGASTECNVRERTELLEYRHYALLQLRRGKSALADLQRAISLCKDLTHCQYADIVFRMYARQQSLEIEQELVPFVGNDNQVPDITSNADKKDIAIRAYSESGAIVARSIALFDKHAKDKEFIKKIGNAASERLKGLLKITKDYPFYYNRVLADAYQTRGILGFGLGEITVETTSNLMNAADIEVQNHPPQGFVLPVVPAIETLAMYLLSTGADLEAEKMLELSDIKWEHRTIPQIPLEDN